MAEKETRAGDNSKAYDFYIYWVPLSKLRSSLTAWARASADILDLILLRDYRSQVLRRHRAMESLAALSQKTYLRIYTRSYVFRVT